MISKVPAETPDAAEGTGKRTKNWVYRWRIEARK
jgi:hypothetical protein